MIKDAFFVIVFFALLLTFIACGIVAVDGSQGPDNPVQRQAFNLVRE